MTMQSSGNNLPTDPATHEKYLLVVNGKPEGPFTVEQLQLQNIKPGDFVKTLAMPDYKEAHEIAALRQLFGFAKRPLPLQYFGSFDQRAIASAIDWLLIFGVLILIAFMAMLLLFVILPGDDNKNIRLAITIGIVALTPLVRFIYSIKMESGPARGTYGKQLLKIRVTDIYGEQITASKAIIRNMAKLASVAIFFIGYFLCFFNKKQQCLHDMIADTLVVKDRLDS
ncbi:RDD family protein [Mucilaginibacter litoreus]|uniref:RDD family protein n=1 Tax=Mucilaginibacter litoreus TaxID=1048221 RepID=A0ABW3AQV3_9SPHI